MPYRIVPEPNAELPITIAEAKTELRIVGTRDDAGLAQKIAAAIAKVEIECGRPFRPLTIEYWANPSILCASVPLPMAYQGAELVSVAGIAQDGTALALAAADVQISYGADGEPRFYPLSEAAFGAQRITLKYKVTGDMPPEIRSAILLIVGHLNENRESTFQGTIGELPMGVDYLIYPHRVNLGV